MERSGGGFFEPVIVNRHTSCLQNNYSILIDYEPYNNDKEHEIFFKSNKNISINSNLQ